MQPQAQMAEKIQFSSHMKNRSFHFKVHNLPLVFLLYAPALLPAALSLLPLSGNETIQSESILRSPQTRKKPIIIPSIPRPFSNLITSDRPPRYRIALCCRSPWARGRHEEKRHTTQESLAALCTENSLSRPFPLLSVALCLSRAVKSISRGPASPHRHASI